MSELETKVVVGIIVATTVTTVADLLVPELSLWQVFLGVALGDVTMVVWNTLCVAALLGYLGHKHLGESG